MKLCAGDHVEFRSTFSDRIYRGRVEGFLGKDFGMAMVTDQTGLPSRPVSVSRLQRIPYSYVHHGRAA